MAVSASSADMSGMLGRLRGRLCIIDTVADVDVAVVDEAGAEGIVDGSCRAGPKAGCVGLPSAPVLTHRAPTPVPPAEYAAATAASISA